MELDGGKICRQALYLMVKTVGFFPLNQSIETTCGTFWDHLDTHFGGLEDGGHSWWRASNEELHRDGHLDFREEGRTASLGDAWDLLIAVIVVDGRNPAPLENDGLCHDL